MYPCIHLKSFSEKEELSKLVLFFDVFELTVVNLVVQTTPLVKKEIFLCLCKHNLCLEKTAQKSLL